MSPSIVARDRTKVDLSLRSQLGGHSVQRTLRPSNAFVGAELTFAAGQVLTKTSEGFRLLLKSKWTGLERSGELWAAHVEVNGSKEVLYGRHLVIATGGFGHDAKEFQAFEEFLSHGRSWRACC